MAISCRWASTIAPMNFCCNKTGFASTDRPTRTPRPPASASRRHDPARQRLSFHHRSRPLRRPTQLQQRQPGRVRHRSHPVLRRGVLPNVGQGLTVKVGRMFCQYGVEGNDAPSNALCRTPTRHLQPFTQTGIMGTPAVRRVVDPERHHNAPMSSSIPRRRPITWAALAAPKMATTLPSR